MAENEKDLLHFLANQISVAHISMELICERMPACSERELASSALAAVKKIADAIEARRQVIMAKASEA